MRVEVTKVDQSENHGFYVFFDSPVGKCYAKWRGTRQPELRGYSVEIDINQKMSKSNVVLSLPDSDKRLLIEKGDVFMFGELEGMDDDGMGYLRIHDSCIIMVECELPYPEVGEKVRMTLRPKDFEVTPIKKNGDGRIIQFL